MAKLALLLALTACILVAHVSAYKTVITTTIIHDNGWVLADGLPTATTAAATQDNGWVLADGLPTTTAAATQDNGWVLADGLPTTTTTAAATQDNGWVLADALPVTTTATQDNGWVLADALPTEKDNQRSRRGGSQKQCRRQVEEQQLNHCEMHLTLSQTQGQRQEEEHLQLCCDQLRQVAKQCQCEVIQNVVQHVAQKYQQQQQQGGRHGGQGQDQKQQIKHIFRKAQMLPQQCNLQLQQCRVKTPFRIPRV